MKLRTIARLGAILSLILFCVGVGFYSFVHLNEAEKNKKVDLLSLVPAGCVGLIETDNVDFLLSEFPQAAYAMQLDTLRHSGLFATVMDNLPYVVDNSHGLGNQMNRLMVSFHSPFSVRDMVVYFRLSDPGKKFLKELLESSGKAFVSRKEKYRGKDIEIFPVRDGNFISTYGGNGFLAVSYQKRLIEQVIDAEKDRKSLRYDRVFTEGYRAKSANFMTLYGRTSSLPVLADPHSHCWSEFDIHLNSEVFYLSGCMYEPDSCMERVHARLDAIPPLVEDSVLILSGEGRVDSCVSQVVSASRHSLFDECVSNLSRDASFIMVADMDKVIRAPQRYAPYLPAFVSVHPELFRSFILSAQITKVGNRLSHIFVFTYKV